MATITTQPQDGLQPLPIVNLPPGLADLQNITEIKIHQHLDSTEGK